MQLPQLFRNRWNQDFFFKIRIAVEVAKTHIVSLIMALMLGFVQLFLETVFVARQHIVTGMSLITCTECLSDRTVFPV